MSLSLPKFCLAAGDFYFVSVKCRRICIAAIGAESFDNLHNAQHHAAFQCTHSSILTRNLKRGPSKRTVVNNGSLVRQSVLPITTQSATEATCTSVCSPRRISLRGIP